MTVEPPIRELAGLLWRLADLVQAAENRRSFRAKAYRRAVWALDDLPSLDAGDEELLSVPGIGPGVTALIKEFRSTSGLKQLVPLEEVYPRDTPRLRRLPRMTPTMLRALKVLGVETTEDLRSAIESGAAATMKGAGAQTLDLWHRILALAPDIGHVPAHQAWVTAAALAHHISDHTGSSIDIAGAVRRMEEWVERIDLVAVTEDREGLIAFLSTTASLHWLEIDQNIARGSTHSGVEVGVHPTSPESGGTTLLWATGPEDHAAAITKEPFATEHEAYRSIGLSLIPPPARHLPLGSASKVVRVDDLQGDLHVHSELSPDGRMTLVQILDSARDRGYGYIGITDHTKGLRFGGLDETAIAAQAQLLVKIREHFPDIRLLHGAELNIGPDGGLDLDDDALELLDFAVAGVHSHFGLDQETQTKRILAALGHPSVRVLAHPSGRRIGIRPPLSFDMEAVIDAAVENGVALEVNGHRDRLDLAAAWVGRAAPRGALFAANSDGHRINEMANIENAIGVLQRAGIGRERVVNALDVDEFLEWVSSG